MNVSPRLQRILNYAVFSKNLSFSLSRSYLKNADYVQGQGAGRRKSAAYTGVCEHFEEVRNTVSYHI
jgi:hypothetical protein